MPRSSSRPPIGMGLDDRDGLLDAEELLTVDGRVRFRHPLVRSAIYRRASAADRRQVHAALAEAMSPGDDDDRRAWHRAHAAAGPDETVAAELEASADRAQARGGLSAAAAFLRARGRADAGSPAARAACARGRARSPRCRSDGRCVRPADGSAQRPAGRVWRTPTVSCSRRRSRSAPGGAATRRRCSPPRPGVSSRSTPDCVPCRVSRGDLGGVLRHASRALRAGRSKSLPRPGPHRRRPGLRVRTS